MYCLRLFNNVKEKAATLVHKIETREKNNEFDSD